VGIHGDAAQGYAVTAAMTASQRRQENVINLFLLSAEQLLIKAKSKPVCSRKGSWIGDGAGAGDGDGASAGADLRLIAPVAGCLSFCQPDKLHPSIVHLLLLQYPSNPQQDSPALARNEGT